MSALPSASGSSSPRAGLWLTGAAVLALAVQAIFVFVPEPKSAGATDPAAAEATSEAITADSTAFLLEDGTTPLPADAPVPDTTANASPAADSLPAAALPLPAVEPPTTPADSVTSADSAANR